MKRSFAAPSPVASFGPRKKSKESPHDHSGAKSKPPADCLKSRGGNCITLRPTPRDRIVAACESTTFIYQQVGDSPPEEFLRFVDCGATIEFLVCGRFLFSAKIQVTTGTGIFFNNVRLELLRGGEVIVAQELPLPILFIDTILTLEATINVEPCTRLTLRLTRQSATVGFASTPIAIIPENSVVSIIEC